MDHDDKSGLQLTQIKMNSGDSCAMVSILLGEWRRHDLCVTLLHRAQSILLALAPTLLSHDGQFITVDMFKSLEATLGRCFSKLCPCICSTL